MPRVRLLAPVVVGDKLHAPGEEVDVDDQTFADLRSDGKASSLDEEKAAAERASEGNYTARAGRQDVASTKTEEPPPGPSKPRGKD